MIKNDSLFYIGEPDVDNEKAFQTQYVYSMQKNTKKMTFNMEINRQ